MSKLTMLLGSADMNENPFSDAAVRAFIFCTLTIVASAFCFSSSTYSDGISTILPVLKFLALGLTGIFGVMAVVIDYRDEKKRLTRWGYLAIGGIFASTAVAVGSQSLENISKSQDEKRAKENNEEVLRNISRTVDPLDKLSVEAKITLNLDQSALRSYRDRLLNGLKDVVAHPEPYDIFADDAHRNGIQITSTGVDGQVDEVCVAASSTLYPNRGQEAVAYSLIHYPQLRLKLLDGNSKPSIKSNKAQVVHPDNDVALSAYLRTTDRKEIDTIVSYEKDNKYENAQICYRFSDSEFSVSMKNMETKSEYFRGRSNFISVPEFGNRKIEISIAETMVVSLDKEDHRNQELHDARATMELENIIFKFSHGRAMLLFPTKNLKKKSSDLSYYEMITPNISGGIVSNRE